MSPPCRFANTKLSPTRLMLAGWSALALIWINTPQGFGQVQIPDELLKDEKVTVVQLSAQQALQGLETDYAELVKTKGADHPDTREVLGQLTEVKRRLAALGMPMNPIEPSATQNRMAPASPTTDAKTIGDSVPLTSSQVELMQSKFRDMRLQLGPDHPTVRKMGELILAAGGSLPAMTASSSSFSAEDRVADQDPWQVLLGLVQRVAALEAEVAGLRAEVQRLRSTSPSTGSRLAPELLPTLPSTRRREPSPAVPLPQ